MIIVFIIISLLLIYTIFFNIVYYISAKSVFNKKNDNKDICKDNLYLIVPIYNEHEYIYNSLIHFYGISKNENIKTIFVATEKETANPTTYDLAKKIIKEKNLDNFIKLIKYNKKNGVMAHQINYAIEYLKKVDKTNFIIGIYNVDSKLNGEEISFVRKNISNNNCIQQYSYLENKGFNNIIKSTIAWQNKWSILFEIGRNQFNIFIKKKLKSSVFVNLFLEKMNYVIGHGFYAKISLLEENGYFPEDSINEDAFLGLILNYKKIDIIPMPYLEKICSVSKLKNYIKQQSVWFNGPAMAFQYYKKIIKKKNNNNYLRKINIDSKKDKLRLFILSCKLFLHSIYWISAFYIYILLYGILSYHLFGIMGVILVFLLNFINLNIFNYISYKLIKKETKTNNLSLKIFHLTFLHYFIHTLGPILCVLKIIMKKNNIKNKYKTERY